MKLYGHLRSSAAFRVRIALHLKGMAGEQESIRRQRDDQARPDYPAVNRQGPAPAPQTDRATLIQSPPIIEYPDEVHAHRLDLGAHPTIRRIDDTRMNLAAFAAAHPDHQPDYEA